MYFTTLDDLGETAGPRIDRIQPARPPWWDRQFRELKKLIFLAPIKCPIDLFGPVANRTILERLHVAFPKRGLAACKTLAKRSWLTLTRGAYLVVLRERSGYASDVAKTLLVRP